MRRFTLRWVVFLFPLSLALTATACCDHSAFDMVIEVPPEERDKTCEEICGQVILSSDVDGFADCSTSNDKTTVVCTFTYTTCPQELL